MEPFNFLLTFLMLFTFMEAATITDNIFLDLSVDEAPIGTIHVGLFGRAAKNTARTLVQLTTDGALVGGKRRRLAGTSITRIIPNLMIEGGDCPDDNGNMPSLHLDTSTTPPLSFDMEGIMAMSTTISNPKGCKFFITVGSAPWLNSKFVPVGKVLNGMSVLVKIAALATDTKDVPINRVRITGTRHTSVEKPFYVQLSPPHGMSYWIKWVGGPVLVTLAMAVFVRRLLGFIDLSSECDFDEIAARQLQEKAVVENTAQRDDMNYPKKDN